MDGVVILSIIVGIVATLLLASVLIVIDKKADERGRRKSKFNDIRIGMSEAELYSQFGMPKQVFEADGATKVLTYNENKYAFLFLLCVCIEAQVSIKDGVVKNVSVSIKK